MSRFSRRTASSKPRRCSQSSPAGRGQNRHATVYDAVAGRISVSGFLDEAPRISKNRDTLSSSTLSIPPEEALFNRRAASGQEHDYRSYSNGEDLTKKQKRSLQFEDIYFADKHLSERQKLPESDLLKAVHTYASDFYGRTFGDGALVDYESLDETALLGIGIWLEEMAEHILGATGDLAFVEGEPVERERVLHDVGSSGKLDGERVSVATFVAERPEAITSDSRRNSKEMPARKKRKTRHNSEEAH